jgi:L-ascorbate metabolism protein UlaG (beta-lactamase superfamily)
VILDGSKPYLGGGLRVTPVPTHEGDLDEPDNFSFIYEWGDSRTLHLGDCQGLMVALADPLTQQRAREKVLHLYPDHYDLVLLPIGFVRDILEEAAAFAALLDTDRLVPMHYWEPADRDRFLEMVRHGADERGRPYRVRADPSARMTIHGGVGRAEVVEVTGLTPGPGARLIPQPPERQNPLG